MFLDQNGEKISITDLNMTRFSLTMDEALDFILESVFLGKGSEVFVPKLCAYSITDLKNAVSELIQETGEKYISIRPGEKLHETLINSDETRYVWEFKDRYILFNPLKSESEFLTRLTCKSVLRGKLLVNILLIISDMLSAS